MRSIGKHRKTCVATPDAVGGHSKQQIQITPLFLFFRFGTFATPSMGDPAALIL